MRLLECIHFTLKDTLKACCGQRAVVYTVLLSILVVLAICVASFALSSSPDTAHRLSRFITPTSARWPAHYSQQRITLSRILQDLRTGIIELRFVEGCTDLFFDVDLHVDLESYFKLFWWKISPLKSVETISEPLPCLVQEFGQDRCLSLSETRSFHSISRTISSFAASLPHGARAAIEFSTVGTPEPSTFSRTSVLRNLPYILLPDSSQPPKETLQQTLLSMNPMLGRDCRVKAIHNLSDAYSMHIDAYEDYWLVETQSAREEVVTKLGLEDWRMCRLKLLLESALYRRGDFERWVVVLEKL